MRIRLAVAAALVKERTEQLGKDDPVGFCKPGGAVRILTYPPYRKFLQLPDLFVILSEHDVTYRQLFLDGRPLPEDPDPTFNGYSTGRWEGDALLDYHCNDNEKSAPHMVGKIADCAIDFCGDLWLDFGSSPLISARLRSVARECRVRRMAVGARLPARLE